MSAGALRSVIFGCEGHRLTVEEARFFAEAQPWGAILFARNVESPDQLRALTSELRDAVGWNLPILVDQEGGRVQRLGAPHWRIWPDALRETRRAFDPARAMELRAIIIALELRKVGIDINCAPLADIAHPDTHPFLRSRCYGTTVESVGNHAMATAAGLRQGGVLPVLKHMPGHGRARADSHHALPVVAASAEALRAKDFMPFRWLAHLPLGMTAHVVYTAFDPDAPATTSPVMIRLIREEIKFNGLLMTDDISMQALQGPVSARAAAALRAGCDLVLHCNGDLAEMRALAGACPLLDGPSRTRAEAALAERHPAPDPLDLHEIEVEYLTLNAGLDPDDEP